MPFSAPTFSAANAQEYTSSSTPRILHLRDGARQVTEEGALRRRLAEPFVRDEIRAGPWIEACIDSFGPARSMFESNFPVQKRWCSYQVCWNAFKCLAAGASADEKHDLFAGAAARAYRMKL